MENNFAPKDIRGIPDEVIQEQLQKGIKNLKKDDKYFTPSIEDIRVGYECEIGHYTYTFPNGLSSASENWTLKVLDEDDVAKITKFRTILEDVELPTIWVRVPYLTKEQIEAEGWEQRGDERYFYKAPNYLAFYDFDEKRLNLSSGTPPMWLNHWYVGECKDINTFRYICKLLGI